MQYAILFAVVAPLVAAHGKIAAVQGDAGGNGTALAIKGAVVPGPGKNKVTEVDTTVFGSTKLATNGLGKTTGSGKNTVDMVAQSMALSGDTLPQVSANGGTIDGVVHIVTTDGAGPYGAMIDPTGTGAFATGTKAQVMTQVPGNRGNIRPDGSVKQRSIAGRALYKRAKNVNQDYPIKIAVPAGMSCTGTMAGQENVCLMKIANSNPAGPFGGVIAFQMAGAGAGAGAASTADTATAATAATKRNIPTHASADDVDGDDFEIPEESDD